MQAHEQDGWSRHDWLLSHEDPLGLSKGKRDEADDRSGGHEKRIADLPTERHGEGFRRNRRRHSKTVTLATSSIKRYSCTGGRYLANAQPFMTSGGALAQSTSLAITPMSLGQLTLYFLKLGTIGFGGPAALVGYMRKDLVDDKKCIDESTYNLSIALAQIMPGPLAAQTAIAIGYFQGGVLGATLVGAAFIVPSFLMVLALSWLYVTYGGLPWMQAVFYGIGAVVIAIIAIAAYRLARCTNKRDPLLWNIFTALFLATVWSGAELAVLFILAGLVTLCVRAWPGTQRGAAI